MPEFIQNLNGTASQSALQSFATGLLPPDNIVFGLSPAMQLVRQKIEKIRSSDLPVLIQGESGTGKEIIAQIIHHGSASAPGKLVKVNCPAIPATLVESELFGYEKGAFTGANGNKLGRIELANRGTLFLDEIGELDLGLQAKLLQFLQDGKFCPIGGNLDKTVEARVICATNRDLDLEVAAGAFRQDLFYRINVVNLQLPPLRERAVDIPELAGYFLNFYNSKFNRRATPLSSSLISTMQRCQWPGNIRQLENVMKRYVILGSEEVIACELTPKQDVYAVPEIPVNGSISLKKLTRQMVRELERQVILKVLQAHHWNRKRAARALDISYRALLYKVKQAEVVAPSRSLPADEGLSLQ